VIGSVSEYQAQMAALQRKHDALQAAAATGVVAPQGTPAGQPPAAAFKAAEADLPKVPKPSAEHIRWAENVLREGYQADIADRHDARRILEAAGINPDVHDAARADDTAPAGAREIAAAHLAREQAEAERHSAETGAHDSARAQHGASKNYRDRGISEGPGHGTQPGHLEPEDIGHPYISEGHAAPSPMAEPPRENPMPPWPRGVPRPVELGGNPGVAGHPGPLTEAVAAHRARVTTAIPPIPQGEA
jgi:hypothetical protein